MAVFVFVLTLLPYDAMALVAGAGKMNLFKFMLAIVIGRLIRYFIIINYGYNFLVSLI